MSQGYDFSSRLEEIALYPICDVGSHLFQLQVSAVCSLDYRVRNRYVY